MRPYAPASISAVSATAGCSTCKGFPGIAPAVLAGCEYGAGWADHAEVETVLAMVEMRGLVTEPQQAQEDCRPAVQIGAVEARSRCSLLIAQLSR